MDRLLKVAMPLAAVAVVVPLSEPPPGFVPIARVTRAELVETGLPFASWTCTVSTPRLDPAIVLAGVLVNASFVAAPTTVKDALVAPLRPLLVATSV